MELAGSSGEPACDRGAALVVLVTMRTSNDSLANELRKLVESDMVPGIRSFTATGDCLAPGLTAEAVFSGHRAARELDGPDVADPPFRIEEAAAAAALPRVEPESHV